MVSLRMKKSEDWSPRTSSVLMDLNNMMHKKGLTLIFFVEDNQIRKNPVFVIMNLRKNLQLVLDIPSSGSFCSDLKSQLKRCSFTFVHSWISSCLQHCNNYKNETIEEKKFWHIAIHRDFINTFVLLVAVFSCEKTVISNH